MPPSLALCSLEDPIYRDPVSRYPSSCLLNPVWLNQLSIILSFVLEPLIRIGLHKSRKMDT
jgi:hypothetical protein